MTVRAFQISVFGLGYVGSVTAACFASLGHKVIGVDVNKAKVEMLESGQSPIVEAELVYRTAGLDGEPFRISGPIVPGNRKILGLPRRFQTPRLRRPS